MHLHTFVTLQWRLKTHKKLKGLLIRTKKDKCLSACPHQPAKQKVPAVSAFIPSPMLLHPGIPKSCWHWLEVPKEKQVIKIKRGNVSL